MRAEVIHANRSTIEDLYRVTRKAVRADGAIVCTAPTGDDPAQARAEVFVALRQYVKGDAARAGRAVPGWRMSAGTLFG